MTERIRIATRKSELAMWQANHVAALLRAQHPGIEVDMLPMVTRGVIIRGNNFRHCGENALDIKSCRYWTIENNVFYDAKGSGNGPVKGWNRNVFSTITRGSRTAAHDIIIRRNLFIDTCPATRFFAGDGVKAQAVHIYNNTIMGCNRDYTGYNSEGDVDSGNISKLMVGHRMQGGSLAERCTFANNIVGGQNTAEIALRILNTTGQYYNYNWYWNTRGETFVSLTNDNKDWSRKTFTQWKSLLGAQANIRGAEAQSTSGTNPRFINGPERPNYETKLSDSQVRRVTDVFDHLDYRLRSSSPAINQGGPIAYATNAGDQSDALKVDDATRFCDGYGITEGDKIRIGNSDLVVEVTAINYSTNTLTLSESEDWEIGHAVYLDYNGDAPDPGWMETDYA